MSIRIETMEEFYKDTEVSIKYRRVKFENILKVMDRKLMTKLSILKRVRSFFKNIFSNSDRRSDQKRKEIIMGELCLRDIIEQNSSIELENEAMRLQIREIRREQSRVKNCIDVFAENKTNIKKIRKQLRRRLFQQNSTKSILMLKNSIN